VRRLIVSSACAALLMSSVGSAVAKQVCNTPTEVSAVQIRQLQIQMMISTLRCDSSSYDFRQHYAGFMDRVNPLLPENAKLVKTMLSRTGKGGVDQYLTSMSNDAQNLSQQDPMYCGTAVQVLEQVAMMDTKDVPAFAAQTIPSPYQVTACQDKPEPTPKNKGHKKHAP